MTSRDEFEKFVKDYFRGEYVSLKYEYDCYNDWDIDFMWEAWQASREQMKKECIAACENYFSCEGIAQSIAMDIKKL